MQQLEEIRSRQAQLAVTPPAPRPQIAASTELQLLRAEVVRLRHAASERPRSSAHKLQTRPPTAGVVHAESRVAAYINEHTTHSREVSPRMASQEKRWSPQPYSAVRAPSYRISGVHAYARGPGTGRPTSVSPVSSIKKRSHQPAQRSARRRYDDSSPGCIVMAEGTTTRAQAI